MEAIALFNNKGGVGKTTLACNLSSYLSKNNKKVLLIDADPQCNSTVYCFGEELFAQVYYGKNGYTIFNVVQPVNRGVGYAEDIKLYELNDFGISFLAGSPQLAFFEDTLAQDWSQALSGAERGIRTTMTFNNLVNRYRDYDYIVFDVGPSLGAINRAILLACDYFITPMSSDIFSVLAIENIGRTIHKWKNDFKSGFERCPDEDVKQQFKPIAEIKFAGYIIQQYTSKTIEGVNRPVQAYERILSEIPNVVKEQLAIAVNGKSKMDLNYLLGSIPNFNSLIPLSQAAHKPIFELKSSDGIVGAHFARVRDYKDVIDKIEKRLRENLEKL